MPRSPDDRALALVRLALDEPWWVPRPPAAPGHYWWRAGPSLPATVARVQKVRYGRGPGARTELRVFFLGDQHPKRPDLVGGLWCGPLEEPAADAGRQEVRDDP